MAIECTKCWAEFDDPVAAEKCCTGYNECACRDCPDVVVDDDLCAYCEEAGCEKRGGECDSPYAYGGDPESFGSEGPTETVLYAPKGGGK